MSYTTGQVPESKLLQGAAPQSNEGPRYDRVSKEGAKVPPGLWPADERETTREAHVAPLPEAVRRMSFTMWCTLPGRGGDVSFDPTMRAEARRGAHRRFGRAVSFQT